jgi:hypothetical protein
LIRSDQSYSDALAKMTGATDSLYFDYVEFNGAPSLDIHYSKKLNDLKKVFHYFGDFSINIYQYYF